MEGKIRYTYKPNWFTICQATLDNPKFEITSPINIDKPFEITFTATGYTGEYAIIHHKLYRIYEGIVKFLKVIIGVLRQWKAK